MTRSIELSPEIAAVAAWMEENRNRYAFADISVTLRIHDGALTLAERTVHEKVKPAELLGGRHEIARR